MTDLEKLVRWIDEAADITPVSHGGQISYYLDSEKIADHLLSHGVTVKEKRRPIKFNEMPLSDYCWIEHKYTNSSTIEPAEIICRTSGDCRIDFIGHGSPIVHKKEYYGKTWRCWAEKPTEEERKAAEWEN